MVLHPELGSDPPIGSDRESGCDNHSHTGISHPNHGHQTSISWICAMGE